MVEDNIEEESSQALGRLGARRPRRVRIGTYSSKAGPYFIVYYEKTLQIFNAKRTSGNKKEVKLEVLEYSSHIWF